MYGGTIEFNHWLRKGARWYFAEMHALKALLMPLVMLLGVLLLSVWARAHNIPTNIWVGQPLYWIVSAGIPSAGMLIFSLLWLKAGKSISYMKGYLQYLIKFYEGKDKLTEEEEDKLENARNCLEAF